MKPFVRNATSKTHPASASPDLPASVGKLQARVCGFMPEPPVRLTAEEVSAAILADPAIARAAQSALEKATV